MNNRNYYEEPSISGARVSFWAALLVVGLGALAWISDDEPRQERGNLDAPVLGYAADIDACEYMEECTL